MRTPLASPSPTPLNRAPVVMRCVLLSTDGAPGGCRAVRGDMSPLAAATAESIRSGPLESLGPVSLSEQADATLADPAEGGVSQYCSHH